MTVELEKFLKEVGNYIRPTKERTLFSLGGRGHYENPVSDLLAFFMDPVAEHGLGTVFLSAFLKCLPFDEFRKLPLERVSISREEETEERKRIDLVLRGMDWMILIENKIYHWQANPFLEYKEHFTKLNGGTEPYMVVLSPEGNAKEKEWLGVSYKNYCKELKAGLGEALFEQSYSKWVVFARELILHLENELYQQIMNAEQIEFVERHHKQFREVSQLATEYRAYLIGHLRERLSETLPDHEVSTKEGGAFIRCHADKWGASNIAWWYDTKRSKIMLTIYIEGLTYEQRTRASQEFQNERGMRYWTEKTWTAWATDEGFDTRAKAVVELVALGEIMAEMHRSNPQPEALSRVV